MSSSQENHLVDMQDHDDAMLQAASQSYQERKEPQTCTGKIAAWYKPIPNETDPKAAPLYGNGRFKKWQFILLHILVILIFLFIILAPITYLVIVPQYLQYKIDHPDPNSTPDIHQLAITKFTENSIGYRINVTMNPVTGFPVQGGLADMTVVVHGADEQPLLSISVPTQDYWLNSKFNVFCEGELKFDAESQTNMNKFLSNFSTTGLTGYKVTARFNAPLRVFRMQIYRGLPLHKEIALPDIKGDFKSLMALKDSLVASAPAREPVPEKESPIMSMYPREDILAISPSLAMVWSKLDLSVRDLGPSVGTSITLHNPTPLVLEEAAGVEFYFALEGTRLIRFYIEAVQLHPEIQDINLNVNVDFLDTLVDPIKSRAAIEKAADHYATEGDVQVALSGPFRVKGANFLEAISEPFTFKVSLKDVLELMNKTQKAVEETPVSKLDVKSILGNSSLRMDIGDKITIPIGLAIPPILPIPRKISFPYEAGLSLYGGKQKTMSTGISSIEIQRTNTAIIVNTTIVITPVNSEQAANALAGAINPIVGAEPVKSSIGINDFSVAAVNGSTFQFAKALFENGKSLDFALPPLTCEECIVGRLLANMGSAPPTKLPVSIRGIDVTQLEQRPGFEAKGTVDVVYPPNLPRLALSLGFFHLDTTIEQAGFIGLELPTGLQFYPNSQGTNIDGAAILARDPRFAEKAQKLINAVLLKQSLPSFVGVTGLLLGESSRKPVVTFSKVDVQLSSKLLVKVGSARAADSPSLLSSLPAGLVKLQGVDFALESARDVSINTESSVANPTNISLSIGSIGVDAILDDNTLVTVSLNPIKIARGLEKLALQPRLKLATGANGMDQKMAALVNAVLRKDSSTPMLVGITRLTLTPSGSAAGVIDQLAPLKIQMPVSTVLSVASKSSSGASGLVDLSAVMPKGNLLSAFAPAPRGAELVAAPQAHLNAAADFGYTNPLPISAKLPYFSLTTSLKNVPAIDVAVSGIELKRRQGEMKPSLSFGFRKESSIPDNMALLVNNFMNGKIDPALGVTGIMFGTSPRDSNNLLHLVSVDLTPFAQPFAAQGSAIKNAVSGIIEKSLSGGAAPSMLMSNSTGNGMTLRGPMGIVASLNGVDVAFQPSSVIDSSLRGSFAAPFSLVVNIPFLNAGMAIDNLRLLAITLGVDIKNGPLNIATRLAFNDIDEVATRIATLADAFVTGQPVPGTIGGGQVLMGISQQDSIDTFSKLNIGLPLDAIAKVVRKMGTSAGPALSAGPGLLSTLGLSFGGVALEAAPNRKLRAGISGGFNNGFQLSVRNLGYMAATAGMDQVDIVTVAVPGISLAPGRNNLNMTVDMTFPSSETIQNKVAAFGQHLSENGIGNTKEYFTGSNVRFGVSEADHIRILSKARLGLPSAALINNATVGAALSLAAKGASAPRVSLSSNASSSDLINIAGPLGVGISLKGADVAFQPKSAIETSVNGAMSAPFPIKMSMPYLSAGLAIDTMKVMGVSLGVDLKNGPMNIDTRIAFNDVDEVADRIASISDAFISNKPLSGIIGGGQVVMGVSQQDAIDTFSKLNVGLPLDYIAKTLRGMGSQLPSVNVGPGLLSKLGLTFGGFVLDARPNHTLRTGISGGFNNGFQLSVRNLGYMAATAGMDQVDIVTVAVPGISLAPGRNNLNMTVDMTFPSSETIQNKVAAFGQHLSENGVGNTKEYFTGSNVRFGVSEADHIRILSKARLGLPSAALINNATVGAALSLAGGVLSGPRNPSALPQLLSLDKLEAVFFASPKIASSLGAHVMVPYPVVLNMPFVSFGVNVDKQQNAFGLTTTGVSVREGTNALNISNQVVVQDTEDLANSIGAITQALLRKQPLPGTVGGGLAVFGLDQANAIDTFAKLSVSIPTQQVAEPILKMLSGNVPSAGNLTQSMGGLLGSLGLTLDGFSAQTKPQHTLETSVNAGFTNNFKATIKNLGYFHGAGGLDGVTVAELKSNSGISILPGRNNMKLVLDILFASSENVQDKVGAFSRNLLQNGLGNTTEVFTANQIGFGFDEAHSFKFLSKAMVGIPSSMVLNPAVANAILGQVGKVHVDVGGLLQKIALNRANIDGSRDGLLDLAADVTVRNISLGASVDIGYASVGALVNGNRFADVAVKSGIKVSSKDKDINLALGNEITFHDSDAIQKDIGDIVNSVLSGKSAQGYIGVTGAVFGADGSPENRIDTFAKCVIALPIAAITKILMPQVQALLTSPSALLNGIVPKIQQMDLDVHDESTLYNVFAATVSGLPPTISMNMPYFGIDAHWNDKEFVSVSVDKIRFSNNSLSNEVFINFKKHDEAVRELIAVVGDVIFHRKTSTGAVVSVAGISFGSSREKAFRGFSQVRVGSAINGAIQFASNYSDTVRPLAISDIQATNNARGIVGTIVCPEIQGSPLRMKAPKITSRVAYKVNGTGRYYTVVDAIFDKLRIEPGKPITTNMELLVDTSEETGYVLPLREAVPRMLSFQDYAKNAYLGEFFITGTNGKVFKGLEGGYTHAPDLYLWKPLQISVEPALPSPSGGIGIPVGVKIKFPNPGPLHLNMGRLDVHVVDHNKKDIIRAGTDGPIIVKNVLEGGNDPNGNPINGKFKAWVAFRELNPFNLVGAFIDLCRKAVGLQINSLNGDEHVIWVEQLAQKLATPQFINDLKAVAPLAVKNVQLKVFGIPVNLAKFIH